MRPLQFFELPPIHALDYMPDAMYISPRTAAWLNWRIEPQSNAWPVFAIYLNESMPDGKAAIGRRTPRGVEVAGMITFEGYANAG